MSPTVLRPGGVPGGTPFRPGIHARDHARAFTPGLENIYAKNTNHRFWVASGFRLIHGFAFAQNLRDAGLPEGSALFLSLLSFNIGVETAQVFLCAAAFPLLMLWKKSVEHRQKYGGMPWTSVVRAVSLGVVILGSYWLMQRMIG